MLVFSKYVYLASLSTYYTFYLIETFDVSVRSAQLHLFVFLGSVAAGTILGGPVGDRYGRKYVIWGSILGVLPFSVALPYANLAMTGVLSAVIGLILASAFSAILVYAQELVPGKVGLISGLFFGLAFGIGGLGAAALGVLADATSMRWCTTSARGCRRWACSRPGSPTSNRAAVDGRDAACHDSATETQSSQRHRRRRTGRPPQAAGRACEHGVETRASEDHGFLSPRRAHTHPATSSRPVLTAMLGRRRGPLTPRDARHPLCSLCLCGKTRTRARAR